MSLIKVKEPESLLEVRRWKEKVSREIMELGPEEFHKRASEVTASLQLAIEAHKKIRS